MSPLEQFRDGFADGYQGKRRRTRQGGTYLRAYKRGVEARDRSDNGGEPHPTVGAPRRH